MSGKQSKSPSDRLKKLAEAFQALTHREMMDLSEVFCECLDATNGMKVKPLVIAECFDSLDAYLDIETGGA